MTLRRSVVAVAAAVIMAALIRGSANPRAAFAFGPSVTVAEWNVNCIGANHWTYQIEDLVKQTLPQEWGGHDIPGHPLAAFRAGASIIRQDYWYFYHHPDTGQPYCPNVTPYPYNVNTLQLAFVNGDAAFATAQATDETITKGWAPFGSGSADDMFLSFRAGLQTDTWLEGETYAWKPIAGSGAYPPGEYAPGSNPDNHPNDIGVITPLGSACLYDCTLDYDGDNAVNAFDSCPLASNGNQSLPHISGHLDCWLRPAVKGVPDGHHEVSARVPAAGG